MYVIGIDCGTTSLKGVAMSPDGKILTEYSQEYSTDKPHVGHSEQDPQLWIDATDYVLKNIASDHKTKDLSCKGISFSGQMHSLVTLDEDYRVIRPAILWNDVRTSKETELLNSAYLEDILRITKNQAVEGFTLPKVLWMKQHEMSNFEKIHSILLPKDYIRYYLTGELNMDYSDAAGTLMLDMEAKQWSAELSDKLGYSIDWLPKLVNSSDVVGNLKDSLAEQYGFKNTIAVIAGGADNACAAFASGIDNESTALLSIGTSGVFLNNESNYSDYKGQLHFFNNVMSDYYSMGVTLSAGDSLKWARQIIDADKSYDDLLKDISSVPCGSDGLLFAPYINGERSPHFDAEVRGSFLGLDITHTKDHMLRSVLEGITFSLRDSYEISSGLKGDSIERIISVGGGAKNDTWLQMQADIFNKTIVTLNNEEGPALGAAMLAAMGVQWFSSFEECVNQCVIYDREFSPIADNVQTYNEVYNIYKEVYPSISSISSKLTHFRNKVAV